LPIMSRNLLYIFFLKNLILHHKNQPTKIQRNSKLSFKNFINYNFFYVSILGFWKPSSWACQFWKSWAYVRSLISQNKITSQGSVLWISVRLVNWI
jgi:hypothetical protein